LCEGMPGAGEASVGEKSCREERRGVPGALGDFCGGGGGGEADGGLIG